MAFVASALVGEAVPRIYVRRLGLRRRSPGIASRSRRPWLAAADSRVIADAVAAPELHHRVLRHGAAVHQRRRLHLDLRRRRRPDDAAVRPVAGRRIPGLGHAVDGARRSCSSAPSRPTSSGGASCQRGEGLLLRVPVFRTIYAPVKQLMAAFSPDNESGFKRVVMVEDARRGYVLGFLTREFTVDRGRRARSRCWRCTCRPTICIWATS